MVEQAKMLGGTGVAMTFHYLSTEVDHGIRTHRSRI